MAEIVVSDNPVAELSALITVESNLVVKGFWSVLKESLLVRAHENFAPSLIAERSSSTRLMFLGISDSSIVEFAEIFFVMPSSNEASLKVKKMLAA